MNVQTSNQLLPKTMEAEYTAFLSTALRATIPLLEGVISCFKVPTASPNTFKTTIHEDNLSVEICLRAS
jgi:hypothetical protein